MQPFKRTTEKVLAWIANALLFLFTGGTVYAKDGELDLKTDSMTQKKQRSQGKNIIY